MDLARRRLQAGHKLSIHEPSREPAKLMGQNLGYAYAHLPQLGTLMVDAEQVAAGGYDRVVDTNGRGAALDLGGAHRLDISRL